MQSFPPRPLRSMAAALALLFVVAASGCCSPCCRNDCYDQGACCVPGPGSHPCVACPCEPTIEVVDECCCERSWLSRVLFWWKKDCCCEPCGQACCEPQCGPSCGPSPCTNGCCQLSGNAHHGHAGCPTCACEPDCYLTTKGYDAWRDARAVIEAANDCAEKALDQLRGRCDVCCDFENGFCTAYRDVALGGDGRVPAVPPRKFWQAACRTEEGHARARAWFHGYECGARHALNDGLQPFRRIATPEDVGPGYVRVPSSPPQQGGVRQWPPHGTCAPGEPTWQQPLPGFDDRQRPYFPEPADAPIDAIGEPGVPVRVVPPRVGPGREVGESYDLIPLSPVPDVPPPDMTLDDLPPYETPGSFDPPLPRGALRAPGFSPTRRIGHEVEEPLVTPAIWPY